MKNSSSFSKIVKDEIITNEFIKEEEKAILSSYIRLNASFSIFKDSEAIVIKSENKNVIKYIFSLIRKIFPNAKVSIAFVTSMKLYKNCSYEIKIISMIDDILKSLDIDFLSFSLPSFLKKEEEMQGYFIGAYLSSGSCSDPRSSNYHFEIAFHNEELALCFLKLSQKIKAFRFNFKIAKRRSSYILYLKKSEQIASFLAYLDANTSSLDYEGYRLERDYNNITNRQANLDCYNYKKSMKNSQELLDIINFLDRKIGIKNITNIKLRVLCEEKLNNPEASYQELANLVSIRINKKVSKSNINHLIIYLRELKDHYSN